MEEIESDFHLFSSLCHLPLSSCSVFHSLFPSVLHTFCRKYACNLPDVPLLPSAIPFACTLGAANQNNICNFQATVLLIVARAASMISDYLLSLQVIGSESIDDGSFISNTISSLLSIFSPFKSLIATKKNDADEFCKLLNEISANSSATKALNRIPKISKRISNAITKMFDPTIKQTETIRFLQSFILSFQVQSLLGFACGLYAEYQKAEKDVIRLSKEALGMNQESAFQILCNLEEELNNPKFAPISSRAIAGIRQHALFCTKICLGSLKTCLSAAWQSPLSYRLVVMPCEELPEEFSNSLLRAIDSSKPDPEEAIRISSLVMTYINDSCIKALCESIRKSKGHDLPAIILLTALIPLQAQAKLHNLRSLVNMMPKLFAAQLQYSLGEDKAREFSEAGTLKNAYESCFKILKTTHGEWGSISDLHAMCFAWMISLAESIKFQVELFAQISIATLESQIIISDELIKSIANTFTNITQFQVYRFELCSFRRFINLVADLSSQLFELISKMILQNSVSLDKGSKAITAMLEIYEEVNKNFFELRSFVCDEPSIDSTLFKEKQDEMAKKLLECISKFHESGNDSASIGTDMWSLLLGLSYIDSHFTDISNIQLPDIQIQSIDINEIVTMERSLKAKLSPKEDLPSIDLSNPESTLTNIVPDSSAQIIELIIKNHSHLLRQPNFVANLKELISQAANGTKSMNFELYRKQTPESLFMNSISIAATISSIPTDNPVAVASMIVPLIARESTAQVQRSFNQIDAYINFSSKIYQECSTLSTAILSGKDDVLTEIENIADSCNIKVATSSNPSQRLKSIFGIVSLIASAKSVELGEFAFNSLIDTLNLLNTTSDCDSIKQIVYNAIISCLSSAICNEQFSEELLYIFKRCIAAYQEYSISPSEEKKRELIEAISLLPYEHPRVGEISQAWASATVLAYQDLLDCSKLKELLNISEVDLGSFLSSLISTHEQITQSQISSLSLVLMSEAFRAIKKSLKKIENSTSINEEDFCEFFENLSDFRRALIICNDTQLMYVNQDLEDSIMPIASYDNFQKLLQKQEFGGFEKQFLSICEKIPADYFISSFSSHISLQSEKLKEIIATLQASREDSEFAPIRSVIVNETKEILRLLQRFFSEASSLDGGKPLKKLFDQLFDSAQLFYLLAKADESDEAIISGSCNMLKSSLEGVVSYLKDSNKLGEPLKLTADSILERILSIAQKSRPDRSAAAISENESEVKFDSIRADQIERLEIEAEIVKRRLALEEAEKYAASLIL